jgi:ribA/ribD-fused uncharacterized protein
MKYNSNIKRPGSNDPVYFYPPEFYVFDNFSSFQIDFQGHHYPTCEHAYQATKFSLTAPDISDQIKNAKSAHDALKIAQAHKDKLPPDWHQTKTEVMKDILRHKINQHPYVLKKLLESGTREIIEDSWRDSEWGWGEDKTGKNLLGKLWMELRSEYMSIKP